MGVLQRFERRLEGLVSGAFAKAFRAEVQPVEIAAALQRELDNNAKVLSRERALVPNHFAVELSGHDYGRLAPYAGTLTGELTGVLREHADVQNYAFSGPIEVELHEEPELSMGQFRVRSDVRAGVDQAVAYAPRDAAPVTMVHLEVYGHRHPVLPPGLVIGRSTECDLRVDDPGVSRRHAEIRIDDAGQGMAVTLVDLGSTNGTIVDGQKVSRADLTDGSRITLGSTVLTVAIGPSHGGG